MSGIMSMLLGAVSSVAVAVDEFFNRVTLLLPGNGTNGAQNNTFLDSSTNNFTITRNGNTTQGTFSPFSQTGWSNFFGGSDALTLPSTSSLVFGTGDFCVEFWIFRTASSAASGIFSNSAGAGGGDAQFEIQITSSLKIALIGWNTTFMTGATNVNNNTWNHIAVVRSGTSMAMFVNGTRDATATSANNFSSTNAFNIARQATGANNLTGYLSNIRAVKGSSVYDPSSSSVTVPTTPLTNITNTSLLTCQSNRFVDNSTNGFAITPNGTPSVQAFSPFAPTAAYSAATVGGSGYFDGTGDYLSTPDNAAFDLGTGDFTFECWLYKPNNNDVSMICSSANGIDFAYVSGSLRMGRYPVAWDVTELYTIPQNAWTHIAFVKASGRTYLFANGTLLNAGGTANTNSYDVTTTLFIGVAGDTTSRILTGYMAGVRLIKGQALATASFTPPTAPVTTSAVGWTGAASSITGTVSLLLNYTNAGITDATAKNDLETVGNAQISTTQSKFGGSSMYFDGTGDYLLIPSSPNFALNGDATIEFWLRVPSLPSTYSNLFTINAAAVLLIYLNSAGNIGIQTGSAYRDTTTAPISTNTWYHVAITKTSGNTWTVYVNGTSQASSGIGTMGSAISAAIVGIGATSAGANTLNGFIDDLRVSQFARYTSNFTAPTSAFPLQ